MRYTQNRELSWLSFNKRVLEIGADRATPLFERLKFVAIFQSNLSEFFMIRVGGLHDVAQLKKDVRDNKSGMTAKEQLDAIYKECVPLEKLRDSIYAGLTAELRNYGIHRRVWEDLEPEQLEFVQTYAERFIMPMLSAQIIDQSHPFPHLQNGKLYVAMELHHKPDKAGKDGKDGKASGKGKGKKSEEAGSDSPLVGIIPMPPMVPRIIDLPGDDLQFMLLEDALMNLAPQIFDMYETGRPAIISVTRNADINPDDEDYADDDYRQHMKKILKKRTRLAPVRLQVQGHMRNMRKLICKHLDISDEQVFHLNSPIDLSYVYKLESKLSAKQKNKLLYKPFSPVWPPEVSRKKSMFEQVRQHDIMLSYPFDSIDPFIELLREAAGDPTVASIKITLYRLASISKIAECLVAAAENGKDVVVLMELRARFDEEANIRWAEHFEEAGCTVIYGMEGFKCHSKICQITRIGEGGVELYTQLSTGNYNEKTAKLYTDLSFITTDDAIGRDATEFFRNMQLENASDNYDTLLVAPLQIKPAIIAGIDEQIALAKQGKPCGLFFKTNSVTDKQIIIKIAEASQAGVPVTMLVRGISCLVPGVEGYTDNVRVVSIVGRLLEHSRIYGFGVGEDARVYLSSADLMTRNMEKRVEIAWPILNNALRQQVIDYFNICLADTVKLRELLPDGSYTKPGWNLEPGQEPLDSQNELIKKAKKRAETIAAAEPAQTNVHGVNAAKREEKVAREQAKVEAAAQEAKGAKGENADGPFVVPAANPAAEAAEPATPCEESQPEATTVPLGDAPADKAQAAAGPFAPAPDDAMHVKAEVLNEPLEMPSNNGISHVGAKKPGLVARLFAKLRRK